MIIHTLAYLFFLALVCQRVSNSNRAQWAMLGIIMQTAFSYALQLVSGYEHPLHHAFLFCAVGSLYVYYSMWRYGAALGVIAFMISLVFVAGWAGLISIETGRGALSPTVWNFKTILCYMQLYILWEMSNGIRNSRRYY